jgi:uncharacterized membrane protein required for colicin V production
MPSHRRLGPPCFATLTIVNQIDLTALTLVLLFAYKGYRTGLVSVVLGLTGGLLAFGLAAALAPMLAPSVTPIVSDRLGVPSILVRPTLVIVLTLSLRFLLGFAVRELASVLGFLIRGVPPLAIADRILGILPSAALGGALALVLVFIALNLPNGIAGRDRVEESWVARNVVTQPGQAIQRLRSAGERLVTQPPRVNGYVLGAGVGGLTVAAFAATRLRGPEMLPNTSVRRRETRHMSRPRAAETELADPLAWVRVTFGMALALAMAAVLVFLSRAT